MPTSHDAFVKFPLLAGDDPAPVEEKRRQGTSSLVITVDHASRRIPRQLGTLGLPESELDRHIAWDIGSLAVAEILSDMLDATLVVQNYSRLVIDCNRDPQRDSSIPARSEAVAIPGNIDLSDAHRLARQQEIFIPYHRRIEMILDQRATQKRRTILFALHSMTPVYLGVSRPMQGAVMYHRDSRFGEQLRARLQSEPGMVIAANEPYAVSDETDYSIPHHGEKRGIPHVGFEMRQDLVADAAGQRLWARRLGAALQDAESLFWSSFA